MSEEFVRKEAFHSPMQVYALENFSPETLTTPLILEHSAALVSTETKGPTELLPLELELNSGTFAYAAASSAAPQLSASLTAGSLLIGCSCPSPRKKLCEHGAQLLFALKNRKEIRIFFDKKLRYEKIKEVAASYGLENEPELDDYFQLAYTSNRTIAISPKVKGLFSIDQQSSAYLEEQLLPSLLSPPPQELADSAGMLVVLGQHRFYNHLSVELFRAQTTREGKPKNPLTALVPLDLSWKTGEPEALKFYSAISKFQSSYSSEKSEADLEALKALLQNPLGLPFYQHNAALSVNINAASIVPVQLKALSPDLRLYVHQKAAFYEITGQLLVDGKPYDLRNLQLRHQYFVQLGDTLHLIDTFSYIRVIDFFKQYNHCLLIHSSKFEAFRQTVLEKLEHKIRIHYTYVKPASPEQLAEQGYDGSTEQIIYLSDSENWIQITPVMRYGHVETPVLSKKQLFTHDEKGTPFTIERDAAAELEFISCLLQQHPHFEEQLHLEYFYLHRDRFLEEDWFLRVFETWRSRNITILGFNELKNNKLNAYKAKVSIGVSSGVDWFDTKISLSYGNQKVTLKHLHKSLRNKSRFVQLGDGSLGILPGEWIEKFARFFEAGAVVEESLRIPKINFATLQELFEEEVLADDVKDQLTLYRSRLSSFDSIESVTVPSGLKASLREYQKQGLNWLNFLDTFNFGGCLADDMGLGKTLQVLAFILSQREKTTHNTNLVVVPTTLIFNWQAEVAKFAPSLRVLTLWGGSRVKHPHTFDEYEIILTSYGTLLSDIRLLKQFYFNYVILDESQNIKNPESQRYKTVRLLQSRNKLVLTGTPFENNTFDIYGQLSFACPGLLGSKQDFRERYSAPIDKFKDSRRAAALQKKISLFILRRTKEQVAKELPDKTEMTLFCEMGAEQRALYNAYAREFRDFLLSKDDGDINKHSLHVLQGLTKLRQICNSPALLNDNQHYSSAAAKIDTLMEQLESKASHHKILVFSQFVGMLELIKQRMEANTIPFAYLTGKTRNRAAVVDAFQSDPDVRVFLISLKAGGTGLNLTEADYVYLVDPWWNPAVENQAIDRAYRIGQQKHVVAIRLRCPDTIEEKMMRLQEAKTLLAADLIKTDSAQVKRFTKNELLELLS